jgi:malate/lactate dehydrogenase
VDRSGVRNVLPLRINETEQGLLHKSADMLKGLIQTIAV